MAAIHRAYDARCEMLRSIFGGDKPKTQQQPMTPTLFNSLFSGKKK